MSVIHRLRAYYAALALLVIASYTSGEWEPVHSWLGYVVAAVIVGRLIWAATGAPQLGLMKFYPRFEGLRLGTAMTHPAISRTLLLGIAVCLIGVTATGIAMDRGRAIGIAAAPSPAGVGEGHRAQSIISVRADTRERHEEENEQEGPLSEAHEALANLLMGFVGLHVGYLLLFKRPLARFMLFLGRPGPSRSPQG